MLYGIITSGTSHNANSYYQGNLGDIGQNNIGFMWPSIFQFKLKFKEMFYFSG